MQLAAPPRIAGPPRHARGVPTIVGAPLVRRPGDLVRPGVPLGGFAELAGIKCCRTIVGSPRRGPSMRGPYKPTLRLDHKADIRAARNTCRDRARERHWHRAPGRLTAAKRPGHRRPLPWAGDLARLGGPRMCLAGIKCFMIAVGSPSQGLTIASVVNGSKVRTGGLCQAPRQESQTFRASKCSPSITATTRESRDAFMPRRRGGLATLPGPN
ncbi:hypothetical protein FIU85_16570 [Roseovarius sp. THAF8]|nr:hypothetical protein FIU85_16570 [Roseovarius sp. THAF8]